MFTTTYWVCVDCHLTHHMGEDHVVENGCEPWSLIESGQSFTPGLLQEDHGCGWEDMEDHEEPPCDAECETDSFSWTDCDGCGSPLGGQRFAYTVWTPEDED